MSGWGWGRGFAPGWRGSITRPSGAGGAQSTPTAGEYTINLSGGYQKNDSSLRWLNFTGAFSGDALPGDWFDSGTSQGISAVAMNNGATTVAPDNIQIRFGAIFTLGDNLVPAVEQGIRWRLEVGGAALEWTGTGGDTSDPYDINTGLPTSHQQVYAAAPATNGTATLTLGFGEIASLEASATAAFGDVGASVTIPTEGVFEFRLTANNYSKIGSNFSWIYVQGAPGDTLPANWFENGRSNVLDSIRFPNFSFQDYIYIAFTIATGSSFTPLFPLLVNETRWRLEFGTTILEWTGMGGIRSDSYNRVLTTEERSAFQAAYDAAPDTGGTGRLLVAFGDVAFDETRAAAFFGDVAATARIMVTMTTPEASAAAAFGDIAATASIMVTVTMPEASAAAAFGDVAAVANAKLAARASADTAFGDIRARADGRLSSDGSRAEAEAVFGNLEAVAGARGNRPPERRSLTFQLPATYTYGRPSANPAIRWFDPDSFNTYDIARELTGGTSLPATWFEPQVPVADMRMSSLLLRRNGRFGVRFGTPSGGNRGQELVTELERNVRFRIHQGHGLPTLDVTGGTSPDFEEPYEWSPVDPDELQNVIDWYNAAPSSSPGTFFVCMAYGADFPVASPTLTAEPAPGGIRISWTADPTAIVWHYRTRSPGAANWGQWMVLATDSPGTIDSHIIRLAVGLSLEVEIRGVSDGGTGFRSNPVTGTAGSLAAAEFGAIAATARAMSDPITASAASAFGDVAAVADISTLVAPIPGSVSLYLPIESFSRDGSPLRARWSMAQGFVAALNRSPTELPASWFSDPNLPAVSRKVTGFFVRQDGRIGLSLNSDLAIEVRQEMRMRIFYGNISLEVTGGTGDDTANPYLWEPPENADARTFFLGIPSHRVTSAFLQFAYRSDYVPRSFLRVNAEFGDVAAVARLRDRQSRAAASAAFGDVAVVAGAQAQPSRASATSAFGDVAAAVQAQAMPSRAMAQAALGDVSASAAPSVTVTMPEARADAAFGVLRSVVQAGALQALAEAYSELGDIAAVANAEATPSRANATAAFGAVTATAAPSVTVTMPEARAAATFGDVAATARIMVTVSIPEARAAAALGDVSATADVSVTVTIPEARADAAFGVLRSVVQAGALQALAESYTEFGDIEATARAEAQPSRAEASAALGDISAAASITVTVSIPEARVAAAFGDVEAAARARVRPRARANAAFRDIRVRTFPRLPSDGAQAFADARFGRMRVTARTTPRIRMDTAFGDLTAMAGSGRRSDYAQAGAAFGDIVAHAEYWQGFIPSLQRDIPPDAMVHYRE